jgi:hypothetical protein
VVDAVLDSTLLGVLRSKVSGSGPGVVWCFLPVKLVSFLAGNDCTGRGLGLCGLPLPEYRLPGGTSNRLKAVGSVRAANIHCQST